MDDLQKAVHIEQTPADAIVKDHSDRAIYFNNLGIRLGDRYSRTGSMDDLQKAFRVGQAAVDATPEDHPDRANRLSNLGISLSDRYSRTRSMEDFRNALAYLIQYLRQSNSPPLDRLLSWKSVAKLNVETQDWGKGAMYVAEYLDILPKAILRSDSSYDFQRILSKLSGLGAWTASVFLRAEKSALESLQAVEKCREIYFSLMVDFRSDVSLLKSCCPDFCTYSMARNQSGNPASSPHDPPVTELPPYNNQLPVALQTRLAELAIEKAELEDQKLRQEIRESEARTAAIQNPPPSTQSTLDANRSHDTTGEVIPSEVLTVSARFGSLPQEEIAKIYAAKFKSVDLYRLRYLKGIGEVTRDDRVIVYQEGNRHLERLWKYIKHLVGGIFELQSDNGQLLWQHHSRSLLCSGQVSS